MHWFDNLSFRLKLASAPAVCLMLLAVTVAAALWGFSQLTAALDSIHARQLPRYSFAATLAAGVRDMNGLMNRSIASEAVGYTEKEVAAIDAELTSVSAALQRLIETEAASNLDPEDRQSLQAIQVAFAKYRSAIKDTLDMKSTGLAMASTFLLTAQNSYGQLIKQTSVYADQKLARAGEEVAQAGASTRQAVTLVVTLGIGAVFAGLGVSLAIARRVGQRVVALLSASNALAEGDLSRPLESAGKDELARLSAAIERVRMSLAESIMSAQSAADSVRTAATEISMGTADLGSRTETTSGAIQETNAQFEVFRDLITENADAAGLATRAAKSAAEVATASGELMRGVVGAMHSISSDSKRIAEITGLINAVAFQTNILALNAAVEAARAGDHGRGFAVVAAEVRNLAQRTASAAKEISGLIASSTERVNHGGELVQRTGERIAALVDGAAEVAGLLSGIRERTDKQRSDVGEIAAALRSIEDATQQNSALVEQSTAATESLRGQADTLAAAVLRFKTA